MRHWSASQKGNFGFYFTLLLILLIFTLPWVSGCSEGDDFENLPLATTGGVKDVSDSGATLTARINPNFSPTSGWFEWGTDPSLFAYEETQRQALGEGGESLELSATIEGLENCRTYYYWVCAKNEGGTTVGEKLSFSMGSSEECIELTPPEVPKAYLSNLTTNAATLSGIVNSMGKETIAWFEWSEDETFSSPNRSADIFIGSSSFPFNVEISIQGLIYEKNYYYRVLARNEDGITASEADYFAPPYYNNYHFLVNRLGDPEDEVLGKISLRQAIDKLSSNGTIAFAPMMDGATIELDRIGDENSILRGEVFSPDFRTFLGFQTRDYGKSALYARKHLNINASELPNGVTFKWTGGEDNPARVLGVYGNLTMRNVTITGGISKAEAIEDPESEQPFTLARGGGLAVWGKMTLYNCIVHGNKIEGDLNPSRDRGAFGGGIYGDRLDIYDSVISGNSAEGFGAAGGGIYSVSAREAYGDGSLIERSTITGNRVTAQHAYGGGIYTDGGGQGYGKELSLTNCTIARNVVEDNPNLPEVPMFQYYYRGGGVYMSNGYFLVDRCTIVENEVSGQPATFDTDLPVQMQRPNMGGGGIGATIGDAHVIENIEIWHSILAGNEVYGAGEDLFPGTVIDFYSWGYNLIGKIDFTNMLSPIPAWLCLNRIHYPQQGDVDGVTLAEAVDLTAIERHPTIISKGTDLGENAVLWYPPGTLALEQIPGSAASYRVNFNWAEYELNQGATDGDFLMALLEKLRTDYPEELGTDFGIEFGDLSNIMWYEAQNTWPSDPNNQEWIVFWKELNALIGDSLGPGGLNDDFWGTFPNGSFGDSVIFSVAYKNDGNFYSFGDDQLGGIRPSGALGDIGAIELQF